ncbi:hypothetical protein SH661x_000803 [Planctomicrobium sp. SH661]|uniref:hypothetical protein n=1 Tax=Planctomicrobium sp. SH661 TaxID=3448124 RepID=UPI003F5C72F1
MHEESKARLKESIQNCLPILQSQLGNFTGRYRSWKKKGVGHWEAATRIDTDLHQLFRSTKSQIRATEVGFVESFIHRHPEYNGSVGFRGSGQNWGKTHGDFVVNCLWHIWNKHRTFEVDENVVDAVVQEASNFIVNKTVHVQFHAQLINLQMECNSIEFPPNLRIRRLNEDEISRYHGGPIETLGFFRPQTAGPYEFVLEGHLEEEIILGGTHEAGETMLQRASSLLENTLLCLRTFKEGLVGYDCIFFSATSFCPLALGIAGRGVYIPCGTYSLSSAEIDPLLAHARLISGNNEKQMRMACFRLADAENRIKPEDKIIDAVIGLESLLLVGSKAELSFRFSLNYSMLFSEPEERRRAFKVAHDLYNLRSAIAHGAHQEKDKTTVGGDTIPLEVAGRIATATLRKVISYFLPHADSPYKNSDFWQRKYFGFPNI